MTVAVTAEDCRDPGNEGEPGARRVPCEHVCCHRRHRHRRHYPSRTDQDAYTGSWRARFASSVHLVAVKAVLFYERTVRVKIQASGFKKKKNLETRQRWTCFRTWRPSAVAE